MAEYEHLPLLITDQILANDGFGPQTRFRVLIAEFDGEPAGYAFFFDSYSTFQGRGLFLEDLFVRPQFRKNKIGRALLSRVAAIAQQESCCRSQQWRRYYASRTGAKGCVGRGGPDLLRFKFIP